MTEEPETVEQLEKKIYRLHNKAALLGKEQTELMMNIYEAQKQLRQLQENEAGRSAVGVSVTPTKEN